MDASALAARTDKHGPSMNCMCSSGGKYIHSDTSHLKVFVQCSSQNYIYVKYLNQNLKTVGRLFAHVAVATIN